MIIEALPLLGWATVVLMLLMSVLWAIAQKTENTGIVDAGWAGGLALVAVLYAAIGPGDLTRRLLIATLAALWGGRLAWHLLKDRVIGKPEDGRYLALKARWKTNLPLKFFFFFQAQALLNVFLSLPFLLMCLDPAETISPLVGMGALIWAIALIGETVADEQLKRFKADPASRGKTCRAGLWRYSRHPNYFFEWLVWVGYALMALPSPYGAWAILPMITMFIVLTQLTGIKITEMHLAKSRADYADYQRTTNAFFPWNPRS